MEKHTMRKFVVVPVRSVRVDEACPGRARGGLVRLNVDGKFTSSRALEVRTVKGAPYSADVVNEGVPDVVSRQPHRPPCGRARLSR